MYISPKLLLRNPVRPETKLANGFLGQPLSPQLHPSRRTYNLSCRRRWSLFGHSSRSTDNQKVLSEQNRSKMVSMCRQMLGFALALIGFLGTIIICGLPMWKVTAFIGANIVTAQIIWEGLWMNCVMQSTGQMQCKIYDSLLALPQDLQAARALVVISIVVAVFGVILGIAGGKCTNFVENEVSKVKVAIASGITFIIAGVLCLIPVCWSTNTIVQDFYNPVLTSAQKRELGASLYIGFGAAALLILGGALLCTSCPPQEDKPVYKYSQPRSAATSRAYV
ncbi:hypothetical protein AOLI_G00218660 [Acnodon oligacanthus]